MSESEEGTHATRKLKSKPSFNSKHSLAKTNQSGQFSRPVPKVYSNDKDPGMTDKLNSLMDTYLPKDIPFIQKAYIFIEIGSSTTSNTLLPEQDSTSRKVIAIRPSLIRCETGSLKVSTTPTELSTGRGTRRSIIFHWNFSWAARSPMRC